MFFRNAKAKVWTFDARLSDLTAAGFTVARDSGQTIVSRKGFAAALEDKGSGQVEIGKAGVLMGKEIGVLTSAGYQMFLRTPSGKELPAQAAHLHGLHAFDEDLRETLGLTSLYNQALGTTSEAHMYDRVEDRDHQHHQPWEK